MNELDFRDKVVSGIKLIFYVLCFILGVLIGK